MEYINENLAYDPIDPNEIDYDDAEDEIHPLPARNMIANHPKMKTKSLSYRFHLLHRHLAVSLINLSLIKIMMPHLQNMCL